jgi:hypothetical protein
VGHNIRGLIGTPSVLARASALGLDAPAISLGAGLAWIPVSEELQDRLDERSSIATAPGDPRFVHFCGVLPAVLAEVSRVGPVAYIETSYTGGVGTQAATAYDRGQRVPAHGLVNEALRVLGVAAPTHGDEWDAVGLTRHRQMPRD